MKEKKLPGVVHKSSDHYRTIKISLTELLAEHMKQGYHIEDISPDFSTKTVEVMLSRSEQHD